MKMSESFWVVAVCDKCIIAPKDNVEWFECCEKWAAEAAAHAINNHGRHVEENSKLREFVEMVANGDSADDSVKSIMVHAYINNAKQLLSQLKDQNNDK